MYIGPWQEYRLAKIQDDTIQRLRKEWEDQLREQIPQGDEARYEYALYMHTHTHELLIHAMTRMMVWDRIRDLMQPMMAKLPSLLLASKSKNVFASARRETSSRAAASPSERPSSSQSVVSSHATSASATSRSQSRRIRDNTLGSAKSPKQSNQETHEEQDNASASAVKQPSRPPGATKKKKKSTRQLSALEEVQRRKQTFSKWIKAAATETKRPTTDTAPTDTETSSTSSRLPPIHHRQQHQSPPGSETEETTQRSASASEGLLARDRQFPPIRPHLSAPVVASEWEFLKPYEPATAAATTGSEGTTEPDLEESLDEDEVNNLLNWTDTLLSPNAMDGFFAQLDDDVDIGLAT